MKQLALTTIATACSILAAPAIVCAQVTYSVVHTFAFLSAPERPYGALTEGGDGNFYGTSWYGGASGRGTVFRITPAGTLTLVHEFTASEGSGRTGIVEGSDGNFYGATKVGVFRMTPAGAITLLHKITPIEGSAVRNSLVRGTDGAVYGTTAGNNDTGPNGCAGMIFRVGTDGSFTVLHQFPAGGYGSWSPQFPVGPLVQGIDGNLYGATSDGGSLLGGVIFKVAPSGGLTILHEFSSTGDTRFPSSNLVQAADGNFYGITSHGGTNNVGTIFSMTPAGAVTVLHSATNDERYPGGPIVLGPDGSLYFTSRDTVFKMAPDRTVSLIHTFSNTGSEGFEPVLGLLRASDGNLYGTNVSGGETARGTAFRMTPAGAVTVLNSFHGDERGTGPVGIVRGSDGKFYGTTSWGGTLNRGTAFSLARDGAVEWLHSFVGQEGRAPNALIEGSDGSLYGTTYATGDYPGGGAFRMASDGTLTVLHEFVGGDNDGLGPSELIQGIDGNFYGTTYRGGLANKGTVFRMTPNGGITLLHRFTGGTTDGDNPQAPLVQGNDGMLYGTTSRGGSRGFGTVFKITPDGSFTILQSVFAFDGDYSPMWMPPVTLARDGNLYGVVPHGKGVQSDIYRVTPSGSYTIIGLTVDANDLPCSPLVQAPDGNLYFLSSKSLIYKIQPDGHVDSFPVPGASFSQSATLIAGDDGYLYGTDNSASDEGGEVFRLEVPMPALMTIDGPRQPSTTQLVPFSIWGWAIDLAPNAAGGTGIDAVHVWAFPSAGGAPIFVGAASYGSYRNDVAAAFGSRFGSSGFNLDVRGLAVGTYRLDAFANSTRTGTFTIARSVTVTVMARQPWTVIDAPAADAEVDPSFTISGWAIDTDIFSLTPTGVDLVHIYAYPQAGGPPIFLGVASYGGVRPDVGAIFGPSYTNSGYTLTVPFGALAAGRYRLVVFARTQLSATFSAQTRNIVVRGGSPVMFVDAPLMNANVSQPFTVAGWAADTSGPAGTGVDAIHVWAFSAAGAQVFLGAANYGLARPDVATYLGASRFTNSGYSLSAAGLSPGMWQLVVFAHSTVTGTFNQARVVSVTVH